MAGCEEARVVLLATSKRSKGPKRRRQHSRRRFAPPNGNSGFSNTQIGGEVKIGGNTTVNGDIIYNTPRTIGMACTTTGSSAVSSDGMMMTCTNNVWTPVNIAAEGCKAPGQLVRTINMDGNTARYEVRYEIQDTIIYVLRLWNTREDR